MCIIKALSVQQPAASKIVSGEKTIEIRSWPTKHRGPILIVSSKRPSIEPCGCVLAIVDLVDCQPMQNEHLAGSCCDMVYPGHFAWFLTNVWKIQPFPMRGSLSLFNVDVSKFNFDSADKQEIIHRLGSQHVSQTPSLWDDIK